GKTLDQESVNKTPVYKVQASVPTAFLNGLTKLASGQDTVSATLWIAVTGDRLVQATIPFKVPGAKSNTVVTATLSQFNVPVSVKAPSTS
ncbi:MAG: LppX_LprAFG lipoprotein, partial [Actinomycetota bacterium]